MTSLREKLVSKPWLNEDAEFENQYGGGATFPVPSAKIGLRVFLAVVSVLFALFAIAYYMRMGLGDWLALSDPSLLWLNTGLLVVASAALQWARGAARRDDMGGLKLGLLLGGIFTVAFLAGQLVAWQQLADQGFYASTNPSYGFFYMITGVHGLHIVGGLVAWGRIIVRLARGGDAAHVKLSVELCTTYWHYLFLVWAAMFGLLLFT